MRSLVMAIVLLAVSMVGICPSCAKAPPTHQTKSGAASSATQSMLTMVFIYASSSGAVKQLRAMHIDIIRVRPDPERPAGENSLAGGSIVEAVVPKDVLPKLKAMGFDVYEIPQKNK